MRPLDMNSGHALVRKPSHSPDTFRFPPRAPPRSCWLAFACDIILAAPEWCRREPSHRQHGLGAYLCVLWLRRGGGDLCAG